MPGWRAPGGIAWPAGQGAYAGGNGTKVPWDRNMGRLAGQVGLAEFLSRRAAWAEIGLRSRIYWAQRSRLRKSVSFGS